MAAGYRLSAGTVRMVAYVVGLCLVVLGSSSMAIDWELVARSDLIVSADMLLRSEQGSVPPDSLRLDLRRVHVVAGPPVAPQLSLRLGGLTEDQIVALKQFKFQRVVAFLGVYDKTSDNLQLGGRPEVALLEHSEQLVLQIQAVADANQVALSRAQRERLKYCTSGTDLQRRIRELVVGLGSELEQQVERSVEELLGLGGGSVPYLICELEQAREPMRVRSVKVRNAPEAWEEYAHYTPEQKVDILDMALTSITGGVDFGSIVNGASEAMRDRVIRGWWIYFGRVVTPESCDGAHGRKRVWPKR